MKVVQRFGKDGLATVYIGETKRGRIEFVESVPPPFTRDEKWVLIVSSLYGCPVKCQMCDAGGGFGGKLTLEEILSQVDYLVSLYYPNYQIPADKFKIQFARVGEPSFNSNVLEALKVLPHIYDAPGLTPSLSTIAPRGSDDFFDELIEIKKDLYPYNFQLQFSVHSTNQTKRDAIIPLKKWSLEKIANYGEKFYQKNGKKITLNFILADDFTISPDTIKSTFSPEIFFIKMTPLNPTYRAHTSGLKCALNAKSETEFNAPSIATELKDLGYEVLISIGALEENNIGSNCGQYIRTFEENSKTGNIPQNSYKPSNYIRD